MSYTIFILTSAVFVGLGAFMGASILEYVATSSNNNSVIIAEVICLCLWIPAVSMGWMMAEESLLSAYRNGILSPVISVWTEDVRWISFQKGIAAILSIRLIFDAMLATEAIISLIYPSAVEVERLTAAVKGLVAAIDGSLICSIMFRHLLNSKHYSEFKPEPVPEVAAGTVEPSRCLVVAHITDTHLSTGIPIELQESLKSELKSSADLPGKIRDEVASNLENVLRCVGFTAGRRENFVVALTGDLTDRGTSEEWDSFDAILSAQISANPKLLESLAFVPGNHDINFVTGTDEIHTDKLLEQHARRIRYALFAKKYGAKRFTVLKESESLERRLEEVPICRHLSHEWETEVRKFLNYPPSIYVQTNDRRQYWDARLNRSRVNFVARSWDMLFPLVARVGGVIVVMLNSIPDVPARSFVDNAYGHVSERQIRLLSDSATWSLLLSDGLTQSASLKDQDRPKPTVLILVHHHVFLHRNSFPPGEGFVSRVSRRFSALSNGHELIRSLDNNNKYANFVILSGHNHMDYELKFGTSVYNISTSSATLGDDSVERPSRRCVYRTVVLPKFLAECAEFQVTGHKKDLGPAAGCSEGSE